MADKTHTSHRNAVDKVIAAHSFAVELPCSAVYRSPAPNNWPTTAHSAPWPPREIIEWPVALVLAGGHWLAENQHNRVAHEIGEALEDA